MVMEKKLTISLDEIKTVRVVCKRLNEQQKQCGGVIEVSTGRLHSIVCGLQNNAAKCPSCNQPFDLKLPKIEISNGFQALGSVLAALTHDQSYSVEIVLTAPPDA